MDHLVNVLTIIVLWISCLFINRVHSSAINRELDFLLTDENINYYGLTPLKDEYTIIHMDDASTARTRRAASSLSGTHTDISFNAFDEAYIIRVKPNNALIPQRGLFAEYIDANGDVTRRIEVEGGCHFVGNVISHELENNTLSALNLCNGISGVLATGQHNVYIKPLRDDHSQEYQRKVGQNDNVQYRPHLVYRREADDETGTEDAEDYFCGLDEEHFHMEHPEIITADETTESDGDDDDDDDEPSRKKRQSSNKYLEVMVTVDKDMSDRHGVDITEYTLNILNVAASRFQDESIGPNPLYFHLVKFIILESDVNFHDNTRLDVTVDGEETLLGFCAYQESMNPTDDKDSNHWDLAILLTRKDIELEGRRTLIGIAASQGTCNLPRQCLLCEEYGPATGLVLAHEIGHTFGMIHDGSPEAQSCPNGQNLMAQTRINGPGSFQWSQCSKSSYENFINQKICLNDSPSSEPVKISDRIGYEYDANEQCQLYSPDTPYACVESQLNAIGRTLRDICGVLHCVEDGVCKPTPLPSADGTRCGHDGEVCQQGKCTTVESANGIPGDAQVPLNGGWSDWISPDCSRTCGGGVQIQYRLCNNPEPVFGGLPCIGDAKRNRLCSIQPCVSSQMDYRNDQCAELFGPDSTALTTSGTGDILCQMNCFNDNLDITQGNGFYQDGTRCGGDFDVCVTGHCEAFGCDGIHNSPVSMDQCGICGGNGQSCKNEGIYNVGFPGDSITAFVFETGTVDISINNRTPLNSIAVYFGNALIINGRNEFVGQSKELTYLGDVIQYTKSASVETLVIAGPTHRRYDVTVYVPGHTSNVPFIDYLYYSRVVIPALNYRWRSEPMECTCTVGYVLDQFSCILVETGAVQREDLCQHIPKPITYTACDLNRPECRPTWLFSQWGSCNATCGTDSYRSRTVKCVFLNTDPFEELPAENCANLGTPALHEKCFVPACYIYEWLHGDWSPCPVTCGGALQSRIILCRNVSDPLHFATVSEDHCSSLKPSTQQICGFEQCPCPSINCPPGQYLDSNTCGCVCSVTPTCPSWKVFDYSSCQCVCATTLCPAGQYYDQFSCRCVCAITACPAGQIYDFNSCSCVCATTLCPAGQYYDQFSCRCVCAITACPAGQIYDFNSCSCECIELTCSNQQSTFNRDTCQCQRDCDTHIVGNAGNLVGILFFLDPVANSLCNVTVHAPTDNYVIELNLVYLNLDAALGEYVLIKDGQTSRKWTSLVTSQSNVMRSVTNTVVVGLKGSQSGHGYVITYAMIPTYS